MGTAALQVGYTVCIMKNLAVSSIERIDVERTNLPIWKNKKFLFWMTVAFSTVFCVFILPMYFPPDFPTDSTSYGVGFNNRIAALSLIIISIAVAAILYRRKAGANHVDDGGGETIPVGWIVWATAAVTLYTAVAGAIVMRTDIYYPDTGYFLRQLQHAAVTHGKLYRDIEFAYGPLLFYWSQGFQRFFGTLGVSPEASFMVSVVVGQIVGMGMIWYVLNNLPISRSIRGICLVTLTLASMTSELTLNYSMIRFLSPYFLLILISSKKSLALQAVLSASGAYLAFSISPEVGISLVGGVFGYALYKGLLVERQWYLMVLPPLLGVACFVITIDRNYFLAMNNFSKGMINTVVVPAIYVFIFLIAVVALAPFAIADYATRNGIAAAPLVGFYISSLAMIPSALGRCDELHILFSSFGICLVSLVGVSKYRGKWPWVSASAFLMLATTYQFTEDFAFYKPLTKALEYRSPHASFDTERLKDVLRGSTIAAPYQGPPSMWRELLRTGQIQPSYYCDLVNAESIDGVARKLDEMHRAQYVLMGNKDPMEEINIDNRLRVRVLRFGYWYKVAHPTMMSFDPFASDLKVNYVAVESFRSGNLELVLYRRK